MTFTGIYYRYYEYLIYLINSIMAGVVASRIVEMTLKDSLIFAGLTLGSMLFIDKIFLKIFRFNSGKTVKQQLEKACPKIPRANGMINIGNQATYEDYLFSGCKKAGTCNGYNPDMISEGLLNKKEHCGAWDVKSTGLTYSPAKGWTKEKDCKKYGKQSSFLPDKCLKELWDSSGCTNIQAADKQYAIWKKQNKGAVIKDLASWKSLTDNTHRTLCYGPDKGRWPQNPCDSDSVVKVKAIELGPIGMAPWGACPGFLSQTAKWIGPKAESARTAVPGLNGYYIYEYLNEDETAINATLNIIADDRCTIAVNNSMIGTQSGGWGSKGGIFKVTIKPGLNRFMFRLFNAGTTPNPTAMVAAVMNGNKLLFQTDDTWTYSMSYPCAGRNEDDDIDCNTFKDEDINLPPKCQRQLWKEAGCLTPENGSNDWWFARSKKVVKDDMKLWATLTDETRRRGCYGNDESKWPVTDIASSCHGWACRQENQKCLKGSPGATETDYICKSGRWTPRLQKISFGGTSAPAWRGFLLNDGRDLNFGGWDLQFNFYAFNTRPLVPGTVQYSVGYASTPYYRCMIDQSGRDFNYRGWTHLFNFWAFPSPQPGTVKITVAHAFGPFHRMWLFVNNPRDGNHDGWSHLLTFYAYLSQSV
jgi:hypothetical protein